LHTYYGCRQNFINRHLTYSHRKAVEGEEEKPPEKPKPYQPFSKIIDAFAMDEVKFWQSSAGRKYLHPSSSLFMRNL
jgi:hypothetical protein